MSARLLPHTATITLPWLWPSKFRRFAFHNRVSHEVVRHGSIPRAPESLHVLGEAKRYADVILEGGIAGSDKHSLRAQQFRYFLARPVGSQQNKIRFGIQGAQHARICLIVEFLTVVGVERHDFLQVT